jgi:Amt family ammonium transporter
MFGFSFYTCRSKNTVNILIKNMLDALIGGVSYWAIGWAFAYGATGPDRKESTSVFIGFAEFFAIGMDDSLYPSWFFQFVFAATAATIVSGREEHQIIWSTSVIKKQ